VAPSATLAPPPTALTPDDAPPWDCVVCSLTAAEPGGCCSPPCVTAAEGELERNLRRLAQLRSRGADGDLRRQLAERNGRLSSALLRWRPSAPADGHVPSDVAVADPGERVARRAGHSDRRRHDHL
jgi:hypothetical protein